MQIDLDKLTAAIAVERDEEELFRIDTAPKSQDTYLKQWDLRPAVLCERHGSCKVGFGYWCGGDEVVAARTSLSGIDHELRCLRR